jgi:hypothetical protein
MKKRLFALLVIGGLSACSTHACSVLFPYVPCCHATAKVSRDRAYTGTFTVPGGGATTVRVVVSSSGETHLVFTRDGVEVDETFTASF